MARHALFVDLLDGRADFILVAVFGRGFQAFDAVKKSRLLLLKRRAVLPHFGFGLAIQALTILGEMGKRLLRLGFKLGNQLSEFGFLIAIVAIGHLHHLGISGHHLRKRLMARLAIGASFDILGRGTGGGGNGKTQ